MPERPKGTGCKPVGSAYGGSNPPAPIWSLEPARGRYRVSATDPAPDRAAIVELCSTVIENFTAARYEKYYERNPCGTPLVVTARTESTGELVGVAALHPQQMHLDAEVVTVGVAGDFAVHPEHRTFGPALTLQRELVRASVDSGLRLAIGIPNDLAAGVFRRAGYSRVGSFVRLTRPLRLRDHVLGVRRRSEPLRAFSGALRPRALRVGLKGHELRELDSFGQGMEPLLEPDGDPTGFSLRRSPAFLDWRFELDGHEAPSGFSAVAVTRGGAPVAYAVSRVEDDTRHLVDLGWLDPAGLGALIAAVIEESRDAGLETVDLLAFGRTSELAGVLARFGFFPALGPRVWRPGVWCRGAEAAGLTDPGRWSLFESAFDV